MASDKKQPTSAPKPPQMASIPTIVLEPGTELPANPTAAAQTNLPPTSSSVSTSSPSRSSCGSHPGHGYSDNTLPRSGPSGYSGGGGSSASGVRAGRNPTPVRSCSDIGLPATSMPNLAFQVGLAGGVAETAAGDHYLGVYCSPRTSRRSVDLDINSKEDTRGQYEWIETLDSSSNSLKVLTASSRVGSALSLNSECTTRSIGLLSNDSDSDDLSLSEKDRPVEKNPAAQLRRYLSYPEESPNQDTSARPSQSLCNLKQVDASSTERALRTGKSLDCYLPDRRKDTSSSSSSKQQQTHSSNHSSDTPSSQPSDQGEFPPLPLDDIIADNAPPVDDSLGDNEMDSVKRRLNSVGIRKPSGFKKSENILCYKCDSNTSSRDGRIRQWLQDMDRHDYTD